jgi:hypothetical protein
MQSEIEALGSSTRAFKESDLKIGSKQMTDSKSKGSTTERSERFEQSDGSCTVDHLSRQEQKSIVSFNARQTGSNSFENNSSSKFENNSSSKFENSLSSKFENSSSSKFETFRSEEKVDTVRKSERRMSNFMITSSVEIEEKVSNGFAGLKPENHRNSTTPEDLPK